MIRKMITNVKLQSNTNDSWEKNEGVGEEKKILPDSHKSDLGILSWVNRYKMLEELRSGNQDLNVGVKSVLVGT